MTKPKKHKYLGEMLTIQEAMDKYGSEVQIEAIYSRINKKGMTLFEAMTHPKSSREKQRPAYILKYCQQNWAECAEYSECGGHKYTGDCYIRERQASGVQGISSVCTINR